MGWILFGSSASPYFTIKYGDQRGPRGLVFRGDRSGEIPWRGRARVGTFRRVRRDTTSRYGPGALAEMEAALREDRGMAEDAVT